MTVPVKVRDAGRRKEIEDKLDNLFHVIYVYVHGVSTTQFNVPGCLDNQARILKPIDPDTVMDYRRRNERGDRAPALITHTPGRAKTAPHETADGNHRLLAALSRYDLAVLAKQDKYSYLRQIKFDTEDSFPVDIYELDRTTKSEIITKIMYYFNAQHGLATTQAERVEQAIYLLQNGASSVAKAAEAANADPGKVQSRYNKIKFDERANQVGIHPDEWAALPVSTRQVLRRIKTDEGFKGATHLVAVAAMSQKQAADLVSDMGGTASATKHAEILRAKTEEFQEQIQKSGGGLYREGVDKKGMSVRSRVGIALANVAKIPDDFASVARLYKAADDPQQVADDLDNQAERLHKLASAIRDL